MDVRGRVRVRGDVDAEHLGAAAVRAEQRRQDPHGRRLAGAVRPEQPEHRARSVPRTRRRSAPRLRRSASRGPRRGSRVPSSRPIYGAGGSQIAPSTLAGASPRRAPAQTNRGRASGSRVNGRDRGSLAGHQERGDRGVERVATRHRSRPGLGDTRHPRARETCAGPTAMPRPRRPPDRQRRVQLDDRPGRRDRRRATRPSPASRNRRRHGIPRSDPGPTAPGPASWKIDFGVQPGGPADGAAPSPGTARRPAAAGCPGRRRRVAGSRGASRRPSRAASDQAVAPDGAAVRAGEPLGEAEREVEADDDLAVPSAPDAPSSRSDGLLAASVPAQVGQLATLDHGGPDVAALRAGLVGRPTSRRADRSGPAPGTRARSGADRCTPVRRPLDRRDRGPAGSRRPWTPGRPRAPPRAPARARGRRGSRARPAGGGRRRGHGGARRRR